ncbi:hypothetical protein MTP99_002211 [Tenebrio molitor]|nr:hypothetical protein MTP99_002211 [Tenebrio molitor]
MHGPPAVFTEEDRHGQRESAIAPFHTILCSLSTGEPGLPPNRLSSTYNLLVATTGRPYKTRPINRPVKDASPGHPVLRNYTMVSARGFSALVVLTS